MNNYPEYAEINDKKYKINTDFRVAIECQNIATDESISDYERALAIIYKLFHDAQSLLQHSGYYFTALTHSF